MPKKKIKAKPSPPFRLELDPVALFEGFRALGQSSGKYANLMGSSRCILVAAAKGVRDPRDELERITREIEGAPPDIAQIVVNLVNGREEVVDDKSKFFAVFDLVERLQIEMCQDVCKKAVHGLAVPIRLQVPAKQYSSVWKVFRTWFHEMPHYLTDAVVKVRRAERENCSGDTQWNKIRVHGELLAASCDYLRGLWMGSFIETTAGEPCHSVNDPDDAVAIKSLLELVYGGSVDILKTDDLVRLFMLADELQCALVRDIALSKISECLHVEEAVAFVASHQQFPEALVEALATIIFDHVANVAEPAQALSALPGFTWKAAVRLLQASGQDIKFSMAARECVLAKLLGDVDSPSVVDLCLLSSQSLGSILALLSQEKKTELPLVECSGRSHHLLSNQRSGNKIKISRWNYTCGEQASIQVKGPAIVNFTRFKLDRGSQLTVNRVAYRNVDKPPSKEGVRISMEWKSPASQPDPFFVIDPGPDVYENFGWSLVIEGPVKPPPSIVKITTRIVEWALAGEETTDADVCSRLMDVQKAACPESSGNLGELFKAVFGEVFDSRGAGLFVTLLNACASDENDLAISHVCSWAALAIERLCHDPDWFCLQPHAMKLLLRQAWVGALEKQCKDELVIQIAKWVWKFDPCGSEVELAMARLNTLSGPSTAELVQKVFLYCIESYSKDAPTQICTILNLVFGLASGKKSTGDIIEADTDSAAKRRRLSTEPIVQEITSAGQYSEELGSAALEWCRLGASEGRFDTFIRCHAWISLQPAPFVRVVSVVANDMTARPEVSVAVQRWVDNVSFQSVFEALTLTAMEQAAAFNLLVASARERACQTERQNALLEGGKFRDELTEAVEAATAKAEAAAQQEAAVKIADLQEQLTMLKRQREDDQAKHERRVAELQERILGVFHEDAQNAKMKT